jgi:multiple sugar transport system ATP-binding protein
MARVVFESATRLYPGTDRAAVDSLSLEVADGEFLVLVGPSGCGKSTSLRMLAGLEPVDAGVIRIGERDVTQLPPKDRDIAMVFQNYALYPHMTVAENMGFALKMARVPRAEREQRVLEAARMLGLEELLARKPKALSGGQRQRVAMGRAIVRNPQVFLMDEPLSNLDAQLRVQTRSQINALARRLGVTTIYVTHDQTEALTMGDRIAVLRFGVLQQVGTPQELYREPRNQFVAGFIGSPAMNMFPGAVVEGGVRLGQTVVPVDSSTRSGIRGAVTVGIRPEDLILDSASADSTASVTLTVDLVEDLGSEAFVYGYYEDHGALVPVIARLAGSSRPAAGAKLALGVRPGSAHLFDAVSGERIRQHG